MRCTKIMAVAAVVLMLAVPVFAMIAGDADVSAADPKFKVKDGSDAKMLKIDKEKKDFSEEDKAFLIYDVLENAGFAADLSFTAFSQFAPVVNGIKAIEMYEGCGTKTGNNSDINEYVTKWKFEATFTYKAVTFDEENFFINDFGVDAKKALGDFKAYFGDINGKDVDVTISFEYATSVEMDYKYVNIDDGSLVITSQSNKVSSVAKVDNGKIEIDGKTMLINTNCKGKYSTVVDLKLDSKSKLDDKAEKATWSYENNGEFSVKYKFGNNDEKQYATPYSEDQKKTDEETKKSLETFVNEAKGKAIKDIVFGSSPAVKSADVVNEPVSWSDLGGDWDQDKADAYKNMGFSVTNKFDDVQNAANSVNPASGKSPVLFIVIAVVAVVIVAGAAVVLMKKKSA